MQKEAEKGRPTLMRMLIKNRKPKSQNAFSSKSIKNIPGKTLCNETSRTRR
jgi:hypothetical protein